MKKTLILSWILFASPTPALAQVTVTVPWNTDLKNIDRHAWGINGPSLYDPAAATNTLFMNDIFTITQKKPLIRIWDTSIYEGPFRWINSNGTWNANIIKQAVRNLINNGYQIIITIPGPVDGDLSTSSKRSEFAAFCAELVRIVNVDGGNGVQYWEIGNEIEMNEDNPKGITELDFAEVINKSSIAMKQEDNKIKVGGITTKWINTEYIENVVEDSVQNIDFVSAHMYPGGGDTSYPDLMARYDSAQDQALEIERLKSSLAEISPNKYIPIFIDEYNVAWDSSAFNFTNKGGVFDALFATNAVHNGADITNFWEVSYESTWFSLVKNDYTVYPIANYLTLLNKFFYGKEAHSAKSTNKRLVDMFAAKNTAGSTTTYSLMLINRTTSKQTVKITYNGLDFTPTTLSQYKITSTGYSGPTAVKWARVKNGLSMPANSIFVLICTHAATLAESSFSSEE